jgi:DNA modification methylase
LILEHELSQVKIEDVQLDPSNPNRLNQEQISGLRKAMERFGYLAPIIIDQNNLVADGEHRLKVYKEFGHTQIPAYRVTFSDDTERRLLRQTMNKLRGQHDFAMDAEEMALIYESNKLPDLSALIAQDQATLKSLMLKYKPDLPFGHEDDEQLDQIIDEQLKRTTPDTQLGDIIQLGPHRLICADCTDKRSIDNLFEGKRCDMLLTDPPYGVDYGNKNAFLNEADNGHRLETEIQNDSIEDYREFFGGFAKIIPFAEYNTLYITISGQRLLELSLALLDNGFRISQYLVWAKNNHVLGRQDYANRHELIIYGWKNHHKFYGDFSTTVLEYDKPQVNDLHPVMKPIALLAKLIKDGSQADMIIYDPFLGSGSTLIACEQTGRICYGCEIDPHYCDIVVSRFEKYTDTKAIRLNKD